MTKNTLTLPCEEVIKTYQALREINLTPSQARSLTKRCYDPIIETEIKNHVKNSILKVRRANLKGEKALNRLRKRFQHFQDLNDLREFYSNNILVSPYGVPFLNYLL